MKNYKLFGCKVNKHYIEKWLNHFEKNNKLSKNDFLISSCVVTDKAKSKWIKEAIKAIESGNMVYITGCGSLQLGKVVGLSNFYKTYPELESYKEYIKLLGEAPVEENADNIYNGNYTRVFTKKFIVIQTGCDTNCSFCLTIKKRGASKSIGSKEIIKQINDFTNSGGKEIVLTGINLAAWGATNTRIPNSNKFADLLNEILNKTKIRRIRISSLGPEFLNDRIFTLFENERIMPHFHISIQSFSNNVLKMMNRNYNSNLLDNVLFRIRNLDRSDKKYISIGADIIVGFPGETEHDFNTTFNGIEKFSINKLHIFPYSNHVKGESIPSTMFKNQIHINTIKERERRLIIKGNSIREQFINLNKLVKWDILSEGKKGLTPNYIQVRLDDKVVRGSILEGVTICDYGFDFQKIR